MKRADDEETLLIAGTRARRQRAKLTIDRHHVAHTSSAGASASPSLPSTSPRLWS